MSCRIGSYDFQDQVVVALVVVVLVLSLLSMRSKIEIFTKFDDCLDVGGWRLHKSMKCEFDSCARWEEERPTT